MTLVDQIADSLEYYKDAEPIHLYIHMRATNGNINDPSLREAVAIFKTFGFNYEVADTYMFDFNLNNDWFTFDCPECFRDYGYSLPKVTSRKDIYALARFVEIVESNKIIVFIEEKD